MSNVTIEVLNYNFSHRFSHIEKYIFELVFTQSILIRKLNRSIKV